MQFKPKMVEKEYTLLAYLYFGFYGFIVSGFMAAIASKYLGNHSGIAAESLAVIGVFIVVAALWRRFLIGRFLHKRSLAIQALALQNAQEAEFSPEAPFDSGFSNSSLIALATRDLRTANYLKTADWTYTDFSYAIYKPVKGGEYKEAVIYYAIMATDLPRILPNVLFDSKKDRGRQFKPKFDPNQLHQLEGNFGQYFDTYFAEGYTIDSMSFITPDVMQAIIEADDYDIEIVGNALLLYGPLEPADGQLKTMSQLLVNIKKTLVLTAADYQDDRLSGDLRSTSVAPAGMFLKRRKAHVTIATLMAISYFLVYIVLSSSSH